MSAIVSRWASGFHRLHPDIAVDAKLMGSDTAIPGLYSGRADIALLGRRDDETDDNGFSRPKGYRFTRLELMRGSLDTEGESPALAVLVSQDNPLSQLTLAQLARIASCSCESKSSAAPLTWAALGAGGAWAHRPIHLYLMSIDSGTGAYFLRKVMRGSAAIDWSRVREFRDARGADGSKQTAAALAAAALRRDPYGIAISNVRYAAAGLKVIAIAATNHGPYVLPSRTSIIAGTYPLARNTYAFIDRAPGKPVAPAVGQFLHYALSTAGQADVRRAGGYLPLDARAQAVAWRALDGAGLGKTGIGKGGIGKGGIGKGGIGKGGIGQTGFSKTGFGENGFGESRRGESGVAHSGYALEVAASLPIYRPQEQVTGTIRLWGHGSPKHDFLGGLLRRWEKDFHRYQPHVRIIDDMYGSASAVGALYTGAGDLAILGEEVSPAAERAFERERHYAPTTFEIATGSVDVNYYDYAHMVFVNRANPIDRLTLPQLAGILGDPPAGRGASPIRTWGELGLTGRWADRKIQAYSWRFDQDFGLFLRARVLGGSEHWNPQVHQFVTHEYTDGRIDDRGEQIVQALARDPYGIAISNSRFANPSIKLVKLAATPSGPYVMPSVQTLISQQYPLTRIIPAVVDVPPGQPMDPAIREFLRFILSREGQTALVEDSGYLPLGPHYVRAQLRKLQVLSRCRVADWCPVRAASALRAQELASGPGHPLDGVIRVWGSPNLRVPARHWADEFDAGHTHAKVALHMTGSDTGMAGLYSGEADVALLGRAATDSELQAFEWVFRRPPTCIAALPRGSGKSSGPPRDPRDPIRGRPLYVYLNSGQGAQPLAPAFVHYILSQTDQHEHPCASTR